MTLEHEEAVTDRIEAAVRQAAASPASQEFGDVDVFLRLYYAHAVPEDIDHLTPDDLAGAALAQRAFAHRRSPGTTALRVYTPDPAAHGWASPYSVLEIVSEDMPFLVDSVTNALTDLGLEIHALLHPVLAVRRDAEGVWRESAPHRATGRGFVSESLIHIEFDRQNDPARLRLIETRIREVLADVRAAVEDWRRMRARLSETIADLNATPPPLPREERAEAVAFLEWLGQDHFTFLGFREYLLPPDAPEAPPVMVAESGLGILRDPDSPVLRQGNQPFAFSPEVIAFLRRPEPLILTKTSVKSPVHRLSQMDYVGVRLFDEEGRVRAERRFIGLFTSTVYIDDVREIPLLRRKVTEVMRRSGFAPNSHDAKALLHILETFPRDELFQITTEELFATALGILRLEARPRTRLFLRRDRFDRFVSALVYVPRERYTTRLRLDVGDILARAFGGTLAAFYPQSGDAPLARIHYIIRTTPGEIPAYDPAALEESIRRAARIWTDDLRDALIMRFGEEATPRLFATYAEAFPAAYQDEVPAAEAPEDIAIVESLEKSDDIGLNLYRHQDDPPDSARFKLFRVGAPVPLSECLPMIENMGFKVMTERPYDLRRPGAPEVWIHDFFLREPAGGAVDVAGLRSRFEDAFAHVWRGEVESDGFNRLVLCAGLSWREIVILRAYGKFMRQGGTTFSQAYIESALARNGRLANMLVEYFYARLDPQPARATAAARASAIAEEFIAGLEAVTSLDEDRILRQYRDLIANTLRTNFFQTTEEGAPKSVFSVKLDSRRLEELPLPRPFVEIFVYSPRVEGVHLRGGKVARGGLRWSDRPEDYRTEILGLMKAQQVKNAVIVPVGAKGGFVPKALPLAEGREAVLAEAIACYRLFVGALLDITDNLERGEIVPPPQILRHDDDDPYLVVAADKGTATFSDIANAIAEAHGFWLGDAFASGGSAGYDHKAMGITARGAWEAVKRHFRELGTDIQTTPFTVAGVGDMSGDVFGNGMLLSRRIRLVAAFDHRHIFLDPDPDPERSFAERERLFHLPGSSWNDYDPALISPGGGVFSRQSKAIALTPQVKALLGLEADRLTPAALIRAILTAPVDLLWFGGIGTYVKAEDESDVEVGDHANDAVRVAGAALRARVVGEGANLACTQRGRIEYASAGGRLNTDAIDNSAGVDCSDHEVNIKIALSLPLDDGRLTRETRNRLLAEMTDEVAALVLRDNYLQTLAISLEEREAARNLDWHARLMRQLERAGRLNRTVEFLPDEETLGEIAAGRGLTRPEIAVLLAYAKIALFDEVLESDVPDDRHLVADIQRYFPAPLRARFPDAIAEHRLRREIAATLLANGIVNRGGIGFVLRIREETGAKPADVARAYAVARAAFGFKALWDALEGLDTPALTEAQYGIHLELRALLHHASLWFLRNVPQPLDIAASVAAFAPGIAALKTEIEDLLPPLPRQGVERRRAAHEEAGVPAEIARAAALLAPLAGAADIVQIANASGRPVRSVAEAYFAVGAELGLDWLRMAAAELPTSEHWERLAVAALVEDLYTQQRALTARALAEAGDTDGEGAVKRWVAQAGPVVERNRQFISELQSSGALTVAKLALAGQQLRGLIAA